MIVNSIKLIGRVGTVEARSVTGKDGVISSVLSFSLATEEGYFSKEENIYKERPVWHRIAIYGTYAKYLTENSRLSTGDLLVVEGRIKYDTNKNEKTGVTYHNATIVAETIKILKKNVKDNSKASDKKAADTPEEAYPPVIVSEDEIPY